MASQPNVLVSQVTSTQDEISAARAFVELLVKKDFTAAGEAYAQGAILPGAPAWMEAMKARMASEGGSRDTAR